MIRLSAITATALLSSAAVARAQNQWLIDLDYSDPAGAIDSPDDTVTVTLWAAFDPQWYAFALGQLNMTADDVIDAGVWSAPDSLLPLHPQDGTIEDESVVGIVTWQFQSDNNIFADTSNPIAVWRATWSTMDLRPRTVPVLSSTMQFKLYLDEIGTNDDFVQTLTEGSGDIVIVPGASTCAILLPLVAPRRRRR